MSSYAEGNRENRSAQIAKIETSPHGLGAVFVAKDAHTKHWLVYTDLKGVYTQCNELFLQPIYFCRNLVSLWHNSPVLFICVKNKMYSTANQCSMIPSRGKIYLYRNIFNRNCTLISCIVSYWWLRNVYCPWESIVMADHWLTIPLKSAFTFWWHHQFPVPDCFGS